MVKTQSPEVDMDTLRTWLTNGDPVDVIDIRPQADYADWHIPGSRNVDAYDALQANNPGALENFEPAHDNRPVVLVCFVGQTSRRAARFLLARDIPALSLLGGMKSWGMAWNTADAVVTNSGSRVIQVRRTGKGCLSYIVGSDGESLVIDPSIEPQVYLDIADSCGWHITKVVDTHIHADHLTRGPALARQTQANYYLPRQDRVSFPCSAIEEGDTIRIGKGSLKVIHSPGHTLESECLLLDDEALLTGDTLFLNSVGRPDLNANVLEAETRARALYHSLQRLTHLAPDIVILPCHTNKPVAFDGVPVMGSLQSVIENNPSLRLGEEEFVRWMLANIPPNPPNYEIIVCRNELGLLPDDSAPELEAGANRCAIA